MKLRFVEQISHYSFNLVKLFVLTIIVIIRLMLYLAQMLKDCNKSRSSTFTEMSFPIIQEIENKTKLKNINLRKKIKQRLIDKLKLPKVQEKKVQPPIIPKKDGLVVKSDIEKAKEKQKQKQKEKEKEVINYIDAYDDQKALPPRPNLITHNIKLDQTQKEATFLIYQLMRKRKPIFKLEEVRRKIKSKQSTRRMNFKQCECCERTGRHKCLHTLCEGNCQKLQKYEKMEISQVGECRQTLQFVQQVIDQQAKQEKMTLQVIQVTRREQEPLTIPKIDKTEKQEEPIDLEEYREDGILSERGRISQNESKSEVSQSRKNKSNPNKIAHQNAAPQFDQEMNQQMKQESNKPDKKIQPEETYLNPAIYNEKAEQNIQKRQEIKNKSGFLDDLLEELQQL